MLIFVIRHGQTDWNAEGRLQGAQDVPLNAHGRHQASLNGRALKSLLAEKHTEFDFVSSPLTRARQTMEIVRSELGLDGAEYRTDERLIELSFGDWEGRTLAEVERAAPGAVAARDIDKWHFIPPGESSESYEILSWRVGSWLKSVERPTVCVAHGGVLRSLFRLIGDIPSDEAARLPVHQDRLVRIENGRIGWEPLAHDDKALAKEP